MPIFVVPIHEYNPCHTPAGSPEGGQFCTDTTRVGITSARPGQTTGIYGHMHLFEAELKKIPGVSNVSVKPGRGAWKGGPDQDLGSEPSWIVSYVGNGEARRLLAATGVKYTQDAVLVMGRCKGPKSACDPAVDLIFDKPVGQPQQDVIGRLLGAAGFGGWTWARVGQKTVLRVVSVPQWGGQTGRHIQTMGKVAKDLQARGFTHLQRIKWVKTEVLDDSNYAEVITGKK